MMRGAYKDLREFLSVLEQEGQMLRIHDQVLPEPDIAAAACALTEIGENSPAIHFDNSSGLHRRPGGHETWVVVQPRPVAWHGQRRQHARPVL